MKYSRRAKAHLFFVLAAVNLAMFGFDRHIPAISSGKLYCDLGFTALCFLLGLCWYKKGCKS